MVGWSALGPDLVLKLCHLISSVPTWLWVSTTLPGMLESCAHIHPQSLLHSRGCQSCGSLPSALLNFLPLTFSSQMPLSFASSGPPSSSVGPAVQGPGFLCDGALGGLIPGTEFCSMAVDSTTVAPTQRHCLPLAQPSGKKFVYQAWVSFLAPYSGHLFWEDCWDEKGQSEPHSISTNIRAPRLMS